MSSENSETRRRILQATTDLLQEGHGADVRMSDIARRAGITRQAVYLHFANRAELLIAMTFHVDEIKRSNDRLAPSRAARTGTERLDAYVEAWAAYIPEIYPFAKPLMLMGPTDEAARGAWARRMQDMREGCEAAIQALERDRMLSAEHTVDAATDLLWTMMQVENWEHLTQACGWSQAKYVENLKHMARRLFVVDGSVRSAREA
ncbi:TetR/AcrR family transcriptional regulator [Caulobacter vibrioides]|uniref:TetR/AcrR family transcriptional regulator n=1 Tax=Caulobacter vibrioides TaxID=155892 RepID=UPI000BB4D426|nr:TetR/AcrR family transcriptional regulator [Caulobacter vibrioides]ATC24767.1 TetR/AcrR family transcriptional regulator [Caulobacter vibrioides]PLR09916.1 TetR/AcrR family transcriptional regulator [Caulobacter vibrioides]